MLRAIVGFHQDEADDWVAELSCLHGQHVRHRPPFFDRPWVTAQAGRAAHLGSALDCPRCDRAELPDGLHVTRTVGPFDAETLPEGLLRDHRIADGMWGCLRVDAGSVRLAMATEPPIDRQLRAGEVQAIPPGVVHHVVLDGPVALAVDFVSR